MANCEIADCDQHGLVLITVQVARHSDGDTDTFKMYVCQHHADMLKRTNFSDISVGYDGNEDAPEVPVEFPMQYEQQLPLLPEWRCRYCGVKNEGASSRCWKCGSRL